MKEDSANKRVSSSEKSMLKLSEDIGKMADRIGLMADRIGAMADRILETQKIQHQNIELMQKSMLEMMSIMNEQLKANNKVVEFLVNRGTNFGNTKM